MMTPKEPVDWERGRSRWPVDGSSPVPAAEEECLDIERALGNTTLVAADLASLAAIALETGDDAEAARLQSESHELAGMLAAAPAPSR